MVGRKRIELTPEIKERIMSALRLGATYEYAANYAGISAKTFARWMEYGEKGKGRQVQIYRALLQEVKLARSDFVVGALLKIERIAKDDKSWQAMAWKLERLLPEDYGKKSPKKN